MTFFEESGMHWITHSRTKSNLLGLIAVRGQKRGERHGEWVGHRGCGQVSGWVNVILIIFLPPTQARDFFDFVTLNVDEDTGAAVDALFSLGVISLTSFTFPPSTCSQALFGRTRSRSSTRPMLRRLTIASVATTGSAPFR